MANDTYCIVLYLKAISLDYRGSVPKVKLYIRIGIMNIEAQAC